MDAFPLTSDGSLDLEAVFAKNRLLYGALRMEDAGDGGDGGDGSGGDGGDGKGSFKAPTSQEELDRIINQAVARTHSKYSDYDEAKRKADEFDKLEDKNKTEVQKLNDRLSKIEQENGSLKGENLRLSVALDKAPDGLPLAKIKSLAKRLTGSTQEELEKDADELFADFKPPSDDGKGGDGKDGKRGRKPNERLRSGGDPDDVPDETDPRKLADLINNR